MPILAAGYVGDYAEDYATLNFKFSSFTTGWVPVALAGSPVVSVYTGSATGTEVTTGVTLAVDFDGITGLNNVLIDLSSAAFYAVGADFHVVITQGTIDSVEAAGTVVGSFSIENRKSKADVIEWLGTAVTAATAGKPDVNTILINNFSNAASGLGFWLNQAKGGTSDSGSTTTMVDSALGQIDDFWIGALLVFTGGSNGGFTATVIDFDAASDTITFAPAMPTGITSESYVLIPGLGWSNMQAIAGNSTAAENLKLQYDTTGLTGDTFPATQTQVSNIAATGSTGKEPAKLSTAGFVITFGENEANNEDATRPLDGTTHDIEAQDDTGTERIDVYYEFDIGSTTPSLVTWHGRLDKGGGSAKNITVQAENVDASTWRTIGTITSGTSIETDTFDLFTSEVGTGNDAGIVRIRFLTGSVSFSATTKLLTDQIFITHGSGEEGYENGAIWFDSNASNTGTVKGKDGIATNPVSTMGAVNTLLSKTNLRRVEVASNSTVTLAAAQENQVFNGDNWTLVLAGQVVGGSEFLGCKSITGIFTGAPTFVGSTVGSITGPGAEMRSCVLGGTITANAAGDWGLINCGSDVAGATTPIFDFGTDVGVNTSLIMGPYHNGIELRNLNNSGTDLFSISGQGQIIYASTCSGTVNQRGNWKVTNTGGVTITEDDITANVAATLVDTGADGVLIAPAQGSVTFTGVSDEAGLTVIGAGTGPGLSATGGATGHGVSAIGGATSGDGINAAADASGRGMCMVGVGANAGLRAEGGATGPGIHAHGGATGATPGVEFHAHSATGDALELEVDGSGVTNIDLAAIKVVTDKLDSAQAEPTGVPAANETPLDKIGRMFAALRNKLTVTADKKEFFDDGGSALWKKDLTDDTTTYTESEGDAP